MKRVVLSVILALSVLLALAACGEGDTVSENSVGSGKNSETEIVNPLTEITEETAKKTFSAVFSVPEKADNVHWYEINPASSGKNTDNLMIALRFDLDGKTFTARQAATGKKESYSTGLYYDWTESEPFSFTDKSGKELSGDCYRYIGQNEWVDLCTWYDSSRGMSYSLGVKAEKLDGFDLQAIVEEITP